MTNTQHDYAKKLTDPRWQRKRLEAMQAANWKCEICGDDKEELNVHHPDYSKGREPWQFDNLQCLCKTCHTISHATKSKLWIHTKRMFEERENRCLYLQVESRMREAKLTADPFKLSLGFWMEKISWEDERELHNLVSELQSETMRKYAEIQETFKDRLAKITEKSKVMNPK